MKKTKPSTKKDNSVRGIGVNTQVAADDMGRIKPTGKNRPVTFEEVVEATILVNPDVESMEDRG